jgi:hypothetical protein
MEMGRPIHYHGEISPVLLSGLEELQRVWHRWRPDRYHMITLTADQEIALSQTTPSGQGGLFAFSGGVDSTFSLLRHLTSEPARRTIRPRGAMLVHGFDIPVDRSDIFATVARRVAQMLESMGVPMLDISTNFRALGQHWEDAFGLAAASCLLLIHRDFDTGVLASAEPYDTLLMPWGSSPVTDPLIRTESFSIRHDGAEYDRTEKIEFLSLEADPEVLAGLRVCWEGEELDRNCGRCEKCIRTALNFWAAGASGTTPEHLSTRADLVSTLDIRNSAQLREIVSVHRHAARRFDPNDPILKSLRRVICINRARMRLRTMIKRLPFLRVALRLLKRFGLGYTAGSSSLSKPLDHRGDRPE